MPKILALVEDLFFAAKIVETAKLTGAEVETVSHGDALLERCLEERPSLVIVDLNAPGANRGESVRQLKTNSTLAGIPVVGFLSHVQVDLAEAARNAGCDRVLPRSKFTAELAQILRLSSG